MINKNIYTAGLAEPELIIRTSGEQRLSGFLMWQAIYSELCFVKNYWPDFSKDDFMTALGDYYKRQRRWGK
jgi:undecaprenyl diphosphate synthase